MKIVSIFAERLYAWHYIGDSDNVFDTLLELWTDVSYLYNFARENGISDAQAFVRETLQDVEKIQDRLEAMANNSTPFSNYFAPLADREWNRPLALQKGKLRQSRLRVYAIKIDSDCFVITGGAIKMSQTMQDHPSTARELERLKDARHQLEQNGVFDEDSFYEFLNEDYV